LYVRDKPAKILIPADRPFGRQIFACAHELGHHELGHGTRMSDYLGAEFSDTAMPSEEYGAHVFAGAFLLPRAAVDAAFRVRGWTLDSAKHYELYAVACGLGVSFEGLLTHLSESLRVMATTKAQDLAKTPLSKIREQILGAPCTSRLVVVDLNWHAIAIDMAVGESALLPGGATAEGPVVRHIRSLPSGEWLQATEPGITRVNHPSGWSAFIRVRRNRFVGLGSIRHMDDPDE